jgi:hypothetical protein
MADYSPPRGFTNINVPHVPPRPAQRQICAYMRVCRAVNLPQDRPTPYAYELQHLPCVKKNIFLCLLPAFRDARNSHFLHFEFFLMLPYQMTAIIREGKIQQCWFNFYGIGDTFRDVLYQQSGPHRSTGQWQTSVFSHFVGFFSLFGNLWEKFTKIWPRLGPLQQFSILKFIFLFTYCTHLKGLLHQFEAGQNSYG